MPMKLRLSVQFFFDDIKIGDSIAVNGVCLTLESFTSEQMKFTLGFETLKIIGSSFSQWLAYPVNLERSLAFGARVHGHFVTGHVESMVQILKSESFGDNWLITIQLDEVARKYCWKKGSITLNGVSLTINAAETGNIEVCLIPETQKRTNLNLFKVGEKLSFEPDSFAKAILEAVTHSNFFSGGKNV